MLNKVAVFSVPRSGSTWVGQIFNSHPNVAYRFQPLFSYAFKNRLNVKSNIDDINLFFKQLSETRDKFILQVEEASLSEKNPVFKKSINPTHVVFKEVRYLHLIENLLATAPEIFIIGLIRNPMAVLNSWFNSPKEFRRDLGWKERKEWRTGNSKNKNKKEEFFGFDKWKEVAYLFLRLQDEYPDRFYLLQYDDLLKDLNKYASEIFSFVNLNMTKSTESFLLESRSKNDGDSYGVYKNHLVDDSWEKSLDEQIVNEIKAELKDTPLKQFL